MKSNLKFTVSTLVWAMLLLAAYKVPAAQTQAEAPGNYNRTKTTGTVPQEPADVTTTGPISLNDVSEPFQATLGETSPANQFKVPTGKRLVIEWFSGRIPIGVGQPVEHVQ